MMTPTAGNSALEKHYTVQEIAVRWKLAPNTIRKLFAHEPDVLYINLGTGQRVKLSIPESAVARVQARLSHDALQAALPRRRPLSIVNLCNFNGRVAKKPRYILKAHALEQHVDRERIP